MEKLLTEREVANILGVSVQLLRKWRGQRDGDLPHLKIGRCVRYSPESVRRFVQAQQGEAACAVEPE